MVLPDAFTPMSPMPDPTHKSPPEGSQLLFGLVLLALGGLLLAHNLGFSLPSQLRQIWPLPLLLCGAIGLVFPSRHLGRSGALWLFTSGLYCSIGVFDLFGLGWSAWPMFVIASGLDIMFFGR